MVWNGLHLLFPKVTCCEQMCASINITTTHNTGYSLNLQVASYISDWPTVRSYQCNTLCFPFRTTSMIITAPVLFSWETQIFSKTSHPGLQQCYKTEAAYKELNFSWSVALNNILLVSGCSEDVWLLKIAPDIYFVWSKTIHNHVYLCYWNGQSETWHWSPEEAETQIQKEIINEEWYFSTVGPTMCFAPRWF